MHLIELNCLFMTLTNTPLMYTNTVLCHSCIFWLPEDGMTPEHVGAM